MKKSVLNKLIFALLVFGFNSAYAYNSIINNGNMTESGTYKLGSELQVLTDDPADNSGANILFFIDLPTKSSSLDYRFKFGTGNTDINLGVAAKWIPIPDLQNQPAIGVIFDVDWVNDNSYDFFTARVAPLISKNFRWEYGSMTPYAALPVGTYYLTENDKMEAFVQLAFGAEVNFEAYPDFGFFGEAGFDIDKSITYFSLAARFKM